MARSFLGATKEAGVRDPEPPVRPVPRIAPVGAPRHDDFRVRVQWMADSPKAIRLYLLDHDQQEWCPLACYRSDDVEMPGDAGIAVIPRWLASRWALA